jgi:Zn-dependent protease
MPIPAPLARTLHPARISAGRRAGKAPGRRRTALAGLRLSLPALKGLSVDAAREEAGRQFMLRIGVEEGLPAATDAPAAAGGRSAPGLRPARLAAGRAALGAAAGLFFFKAFEPLLTPLALEPASAAFMIFKGALLFWGVLMSITLHEWSHARTAEAAGDVTPRMAGQMSLRPNRFTSPKAATVILVTALLGFPVGVFMTNSNPSLDEPENNKAMSRVAAAGPAMNLALFAALMGAVWGLPRLLPGLAALPWAAGMLRTAETLALVNLNLALLNLLPFGPLDGQKVLRGLVPPKWVKVFDAVMDRIFIGLLIYLLYRIQFTGLLAGASAPAFNPDLVKSFQANGLLFWASTFIPAIKSLPSKSRRAFRLAENAARGGWTLRIWHPAVRGKSPSNAEAAEWIPMPASAKALGLGRHYRLADIDELARTGAGLPPGVDEAMARRVREGKYLLIEACEMTPLPLALRLGSLNFDPDAKLSLEGLKTYALLPSRFVGGRGRARALMESASVARRLESRRRLLTPAQVEGAKLLSKRLGAMVYELDIPATGTFAETDRGPAYFVPPEILGRIGSAQGEERLSRVEEAAAPLEEARRSFQEG